MLWQTHDSFDAEYKKLLKKHRQLADGLKKAQKLLEAQFDPINPQAVIGPGKLHRVSANHTWEIWKIEVALIGSGLRPNQWPRMWFAVSGDTFTLLTIAVHSQNYDNNAQDALAIERYSEIA